MKVPNDMQTGCEHKSKQGHAIRVVSYKSNSDVDVMFPLTGYTTKSQAGNIRAGAVKDKMLPIVHGVGFIGSGGAAAYRDGKTTPAYRCWVRMLERCYSEASLKLRPTYKDCSVCEDWHNFQVFHKWYSSNYVEGYSLDKDIISDGNRIYSPLHCKFVSQNENAIKALARSWRIKSPSGVVFSVYNMAQFCRDNSLDGGAMSKVLSGQKLEHKGWSKG